MRKTLGLAPNMRRNATICLVAAVPHKSATAYLHPNFTPQDARSR